ncbi:T7SS effector LXG polymorphic toxin [Listeria seeligeri]|uniref:T7SS effector LXG polymorphic toxin n=1 Tax=Listeria seeligeri TaxID=1640 RepID=UPI002F405A01
MSRIDIGEVQNFLAQLKYTNLQSEKAIQAIQTVVTNYAEDDSLKGKAIDASKKYYQTTYFSLCNALKEAMNESEERLTQYIQDFEAQVDSSPSAKIDAEGLYELGKMIDGIESKKEALAQQMNSGSEGTMQNYRSELATAYKKEAILEKYLSFEQGHGNFFDTLNELVQSIKQTVKELSTNVQFNSQTGTYDMSKLDIQSLERMHQALKKAKDNEETINFDDYQKTYQGHTWILMKDGKVDAEATDVYNEAILNGTLPKETNAATQEAELLKGILASLKNKKDPITGADLSSFHVLSILSGLAFSYTAKKYIGKKLRIPNPDKKKKKKKTSGVGGPKGVGNPVKIEGRGSTGRIKANNLNEQMAMLQVQSNPLKGAKELPIKLTDKRWPREDGWVKMQNVVTLEEGIKVNVHFVYNKTTGQYDDFKFK